MDTYIVAEDESCFVNNMNSIDDDLGEEKDYLTSSLGIQVIILKMKFSCNGAIIGLTVNLTENKHNESSNSNNSTSNNQDGDTNGDEGDNKGEVNEISGDDKENDEINVKRDTDNSKKFPSIQIWRPLNFTSVYTRVGQYDIMANDIKHDKLILAMIYLTANKSISFQSNDIIGYYVPANSPYNIRNMRSMEDTSYSIKANATLDKFDMNDNATRSSMLPMIQVMFGKM